MEQAWVLLCTLPRALFILKSNQGLHIKTECVDITRKHIHSTRSKTILYVTCQSWVHLLKQGSCLLNLYSCSILNPFPCKLQRISPQSCKGDPCAGTWFCVGAILLKRLPQEETVEWRGEPFIQHPEYAWSGRTLSMHYWTGVGHCQLWGAQSLVREGSLFSSSSKSWVLISPNCCLAGMTLAHNSIQKVSVASEDL